MAVIMSGVPVRDAVLEEVRARVAKLAESHRPPKLATLQVGDNPDSASYIRMKRKLCGELGVESDHTELPPGTTQAEVDDTLRRLNDDDSVDAVLYQYPPSEGVDYWQSLLLLDPDRDVDGLHPVNIGRLALNLPGPVPCTPAGIETLLAHYDVPVSGKHIVVMGRGVTLGRPLSLLMSQKRPTANAAVTLVHTGVPNWTDYTREADIVVAAVGVPGILKPEHIKPGGVVVGAGAQYRGRKVLPDVDEACEEVAGWITPRVGGVGPTTLAMLMRNCVEAAERRLVG
jgi:methylenetetrahydrofolate dehydrogenase (NADP+) / methenyltetrahydrofolate cyclohydrolase